MTTFNLPWARPLVLVATGQPEPVFFAHIYRKQWVWSGGRRGASTDAWLSGWRYL